jgi:glycyl-tRNA synthetase
MNTIKLNHNCAFDEKDSPGKRYRRQDAIGTPYCVMVDHQTMEDETVTIRDRDTMEQDRVKISELANIIDGKVSMTNLLT